MRVAEDALTLCDSILQELSARDMESQRLQTLLQAQTRAWEYLFAELPTPSRLRCSAIQ